MAEVPNLSPGANSHIFVHIMTYELRYPYILFIGPESLTASFLLSDSEAAERTLRTFRPSSPLVRAQTFRLTTSKKC